MSEFTRHTLPKCLTTELETTADIDPVLDRIVLQIPILKQIGNIEMSKQRLELPFKALNGEFTQLQKSIYNHMVKYRDIYYVNENLTNDDNQPSIDTQLRRLYAFHALDHIYKTRDMILKNNERLKIIDDKSKEKSGNKAKENFSNNVMTNSFVDEQIRDQGFTRAKVLIVTPFKNDAYLFINDLISISGTTETVTLMLKPRRI
jgi:U3 small nucleolar RNA-associated protein 25